MSVSNYLSIITTTGQNKLLKATSSTDQVRLTHMAVGTDDSDVSESASAIQSEVWRGNLVSSQIIGNTLTAKAVIPSNIGGFTIKVMGLYDEVGSLIAIARTPETQKLQLSDGVVQELSLSMQIVLENTDSVQLVVDPNVVTATKIDIDNLSKELNTISNELKEVSQSYNQLCISIETINSEIDTLEQNKTIMFQVIETLSSKVDSIKTKVDGLVQFTSEISASQVSSWYNSL